MHDLIIRGGTIIDGTGNKMFEADIAVVDGVIAKIGNLKNEKAEKEIDASGKYVTPGFVDISNRSDVYWRIFKDPLLESLLRQGITTIIGGNSGSSLAPIYNEHMFLSTQKWANTRDMNADWESVKEFLETVEARHLSVNFGTFVGHSTIRRGITGDEMRALTHHELKSLAKHIKKSLKEGAFGTSVGLLYTHSQNTTKKELEKIAQITKDNHSLFAVHLRDEESNLIESLNEIISVVKKVKVKTHITHLKAVGKRNWSSLKDALKIIEEVRSTGLEISFDVYPYTYTGSVLYTFLPRWLTDGGKKMMLSRLRKKKIYNYAVEELNKKSLEFFENAIILIAYKNDALKGKTIAQIANKKGVSIAETILNLLLASDGMVIALFDTLSEENIKKEIAHPYSIITSNAPGYTLTKEHLTNVVHPRSFGSFPRLFRRYVMEKKILSWESAVHKSSGKPAAYIGLKKRGLLIKDYYADILIINPETIKDESTIETPMRYSKGIDYVFINGVVVIDNGRTTGIRPGQVLRNN